MSVESANQIESEALVKKYELDAAESRIINEIHKSTSGLVTRAEMERADDSVLEQAKLYTDQSEAKLRKSSNGTLAIAITAVVVALTDIIMRVWGTK